MRPTHEVVISAGQRGSVAILRGSVGPSTLAVSSRSETSRSCVADGLTKATYAGTTVIADERNDSADRRIVCRLGTRGIPRSLWEVRMPCGSLRRCTPLGIVWCMSRRADATLRAMNCPETPCGCSPYNKAPAMDSLPHRFVLLRRAGRALANLRDPGSAHRWSELGVS